MERSTSRDRDKGRKYKPGSVKRQEKAEEAEKTKQLPKITRWLNIATVSETSKSQSHTESASGEASTSGMVVMVHSDTGVPVEHEHCGASATKTSTKADKGMLHSDTCSSTQIPESQGTVEKGGTEVEVMPTEQGLENDLGLWPPKIPERIRDYWLERGSSECQHCDGDFKESAMRDQDRTRHCTKTLFSRTHSLSGEDIDLKWLCYSKTTGRVYCFACKVMSTVESLFTTGFNGWKNARYSIESHSRSDQHRTAMIDMITRKNVGACINVNLVRQYESECQYWQAVLRRCVDVLKLLCERGLSIRGKDEKIGSVHNGNYLGILELLSTYDSFLAAHIKKHANKGSGHTSYLSHVISDELIVLMAKQVLSTIIDEVRKGKYFSISVDSTPDISHIDQLTFTIRYVLPTGPVERFLQFIPMLSHTGKDIAAIVLDFLEVQNIPIADCRGQSYDNASNMSGKYKGVQQIIKNECPAAEYVPCMAHSLNLVGKCAVESCSAAVALFGLIQQIYTFFAASTYRWRRHCEVLESHKGERLKVDKKLSDTRWSARADAVAALCKAYKENLNVLEEFSSDENQPAETRAEASGLVKAMQEVETAILLEVWQTILERFHSTNVQLQKSGLSLNTAVQLLESLVHLVDDLRSQFDHFEEKGMAKCGMSGSAVYKEDTKRTKKRKRHHDELDSAEDATLTGRDKFRVTAFIPIIDKLCAALKQRLEAYSALRERFGFLSDMPSKTTDELRDAAHKLVTSYPKDLEVGLESEILQFAHFMKSFSQDSSATSSSILGGNWGMEATKSPELEMFLIIQRHDMLETFANVEIALRLYLCMFVTNCTGERSFSKLKLVKNYLRNTMGQERLSSLTLLSIEHDTLRQLDFTEIINDFARQKARKHSFF